MSQRRSHLFVGVAGVPLGQFLQLNVGVVGLRLGFLLQLQPVLVHLSLQLVLQCNQLLLMLPPHTLVARHLLAQLALLLVLVDLLGHLCTKTSRSRSWGRGVRGLRRSSRRSEVLSEIPTEDQT